MLWKLGWLANSLKYSVEKDIRDTFYKNDVFLRNRWSLPERIVIWGGKHVFISNLGFFLFASACSFVIAKNHTLIQEYLPTSLVEFQSSIFVAQVTLLGLIFPLVIAFIGILLQGKSSNDSMWVIYRHNSGFMLVGFSALTLTFSFVVLKIIEPWLPDQFLVAASISTTFWFLINLLLSGRFLWKTVAFLSQKTRMKMVVKYTINEVIPSDIKNKLMVQHTEHTTGQLFNLKNVFLDENIYHNFKKALLLAKTYFASVNWISNLVNWIFKNVIRTSKVAKTHIVRVNWISNLVNWIFKNVIRISKVAKTYFASVNWISNLVNWTSKIIKRIFYILIKFAVKSTKIPDEGPLNIKQVVGALFGQLEDALKDNNSRQFVSDRKNLVQFHRDIVSSMFFTNDNNEPDTWLLLSEGWWLGKSFSDVFIEESLDIAKDVTRRIQDDSKYYESWCYLYPHLFDLQNENIPTEVAVKYINRHYFIWGGLMIWMGGFDKNNIVSAEQRDRAIKYFVGSWEHWSDLLKNDFESVKSKDFLIASSHLNDSCCMIVYACKYNNNDAAFWATDVLSQWFKRFSNKNSGYLYYGWNYELITTRMLELDCEHALLKSLTRNNEFSKVEAANIALRNYWTDLRYRTAAYLLETSYNKENEHKYLINALISGSRLEPSGNSDAKHLPPPSAKDILGAFLRQYGHWETQSSYRALMEQHRDRLAKIKEPERVSGRVYIFSLTNRDLYFHNFFRVMGIGSTTDKFKIDQNWLEFLKSNSISQADLEVTILSLKSLTNVDESTIESVSEYFEIELEESKEKSSNFVSSIEDIIAELESAKSTQIINAPIDQDRLLKFGIACSVSTFTLSDGPIPVTLFEEIDYKDDYHCDLVATNIVDYSKSSVSQGVEVIRAVNEDEWLNTIISERMQTACFQQLLKDKGKDSYWEEVAFEDAKSLMLRAVEDSQSIKDKDLTPIMFIGPWDVYKLIDSSKWEYRREDEKLPLDISVENNKPDGYLCHVAGIEIYEFPFSKVDFSILLSKETFRKINVKRFGDDRYVEATFKTENDADLTGTLSLAFGVECEFNETDAFKYISRNPDD